MGHHISAIVGKAPINEAKAIERGLPVIFEDAFVIVPVPWELIVKLARDDEPAGDAATDIFNTHVPHLLAREMGLTSYALIATDYFGGVGEQNAWYCAADGKELRDVSINEALRALGVPRTPRFMEPTEREPGLLGKLRSWWEGRPYMSPHERSNRYPTKDEFDTINLGRYRHMDDSGLWMEERRGQRVGNILVGDRRMMN
ncbi:MAG: hypothetical protein JNM62_04500 [Flavobacteriales bacterium]|nr:hypothetical protein [Flavobacteriales bacterium]